jgi:malate dehydrogenase (oxaloacetate-decarboxylating)(NADP+)
MLSTARIQSLDALQGVALLNDPVRNRGTAFTQAERRELGLEGPLSRSVDSLDRQLERVLRHLDAKPDGLEQYNGRRLSQRDRGIKSCTK